MASDGPPSTLAGGTADLAPPPPVIPLLRVLPHVVAAYPATAGPLLMSGNSDVFHKTCEVVYRELEVEVAVAGTLGQESLTSAANGRLCCRGNCMKAQLLTVLRNPAYAAHVRVLHFRHPCPSHTPSSVNDVTRSSDRVEAWEFASNLIDHLSGIEELVWDTGFGVGGPLWKSIASLTNLRRLSICYPPPHPAHVEAPPTYPRITMDPQQAVPPGFDFTPECEGPSGRARAIGMWGLALGPAWEDLEELRLDGLSGPGARSLGTHLQILDSVGPPKLHTLSLSTHFLDPRLCEAIGSYGSLRSLKHLTLATSGLKFNADCLRTIIEECSALESLRLHDIEGRLGRNPWAQIDNWPATFHSLEVEISEVGSHHSWVLDHLASIHEVPFSQLKKFSVLRLVHPVAALPFPPSTVVVPKQLATHRFTPLPSELLEAIKAEGDGLEELCLDWWEMTTTDLEEILVACPRIQKLQIAIKAAVVEVVSMSTAFGHVPDLVELSITSDPKYSSYAPKAKSKKSKKDKDDLDLPPFLAERVAEAEGDPTLVDPRDFRKFLRRLPNFRVLRWLGRLGKGEWRVSDSKKSSLTHIDFIHSAILHKRVWEECQLPPPSFEFDDDVATTLSLELPATPDHQTPTELPTLSRTTTGSTTSLMTAATPPPAPGMMRRSSGTNGAAHSPVLGIEWESLPALPNATTTAPSAATFPRKPSNGGQTSPQRRRSEDKDKIEIKTHGRGRRSSNNKSPRAALKGLPKTTTGFPKANGALPVKERHIPGAAKKQSQTSAAVPTPSSPTKKAAQPNADGWTTVGEWTKVTRK